MALTRTEKEAVVAEVTEILNTSKSVVFLNFHKLDVGKTTDMRADLSSKGVGYLVAKKSLTKIALENSNVENVKDPEFEGELAIAYTNEDETAAAREIYAFQKEYEAMVMLQGGVFAGEYLSKDRIMEIAQIPGMQELRGMFVNLIHSPIQRIAIVLDQIAQTKEA